MSVWREVRRRFVVWLLMLTSTVALSFLVANPLEHMPPGELLSFMGQFLLAGSLMALNLFYFSARVENKKIKRAVAVSIPAAIFLFPDYVWGTLGGVFGGLNPVISALLVMTVGFVALNAGLHLADAVVGRGKGPS